MGDGGRGRRETRVRPCHAVPPTVLRAHRASGAAARAAAPAVSASAALPRCVGVVGLGLMGGSLALALTRRGLAVVGVEPDAGARAQLGHRLGGSAVAAAPGPALAACDVVVLAVPIDALADAASAVRAHLGAHAVVTDLTSLKAWPLARLDERLPETRLVGSHPMAGREHGGAANADADLFQGRPWAVVAGPRADREALERVRALARAVGGVCVELAADAHDRAVAATSHLPYLLSGALARAVDALEREGGLSGALSGPGLESMLRLAAQPTWMDEVSARNAAHVLTALGALEAELAATRAALLEAVAAGPAGRALSDLGETGRRARRRVAGGGPGGEA